MGAIMGNYSPMTTANSPPNNTADYNQNVCTKLEKCAIFVKKVENFGLFCFFIKKKGKKFWWF